MSKKMGAKPESESLAFLYQREAALRAEGYGAIAGLDEAGRGPLAGPVVAAAVILPAGLRLLGLNDSKQVSLARRLCLEEEIKAGALAWGIGQATAAEIDQYNILAATKLAMTRALAALPLAPDYLLLDALKLPVPLPQEAIIKGDAKVACISAASILAKTCRDREMADWHGQFPAYGFDRHKGYPTALHRQQVIEQGPCPIHRRSFLGFVAAEKAQAQQLTLF